MAWPFCRADQVVGQEQRAAAQAGRGAVLAGSPGPRRDWDSEVRASVCCPLSWLKNSAVRCVAAAKDDLGRQPGQQPVGFALGRVDVVELGQRLGGGQDRDAPLAHQVDVAHQRVEPAQRRELFQDQAHRDGQRAAGLLAQVVQAGGQHAQDGAQVGAVGLGVPPRAAQDEHGRRVGQLGGQVQVGAGGDLRARPGRPRAPGRR